MNQGWAGWRMRWGNRMAARASARAPAARGFRSQPEPRAIGHFARGRQLAAGNFLLAGQLVETRTPWDEPAPTPEFTAALHGFGWLDHLAAVGDGPARQAAQGWVSDWIAAYGRGAGPGWVPDLTGRRVIRWIHHALFLTAGNADTTDFFAAMGRQTAFLARRWRHAPPGLPRFESVCGLTCSALALIGMERHLAGALRGLATACARDIGADGSIPSRNPEDLLEILTLLIWTWQALDEAGFEAPPELSQAIGRAAPALRCLRHADGGLARFHGGGRGLEGLLDHCLSVSPRTETPAAAMGYARLQGGRTTVIVDCAPPPGGPHSATAHASTLGFELTSNRRPLVVSCGSGQAFGADWLKAGRATLSHSTLSIDGFSSARFGRSSRADDGAAPLENGPATVGLTRRTERHATALAMEHDGYVETHGLTHMRNLDLSADGRALMGADSLAALDPAHKRRFARVLDSTKLRGIRYAIRFHLHPDVDASLDMNGTAVSAALPSGELWVFRFDGPAKLALEPSVYLEPGRLSPRPCQQIVLRAAIQTEVAQINWTLAKAQDTPLAIRDIGRDDDTALPRDTLDTD